MKLLWRVWLQLLVLMAATTIVGMVTTFVWPNSDLWLKMGVVMVWMLYATGVIYASREIWNP